MYNNRYNRAVGIAEFIIEGHTIKETIEEFQVSKETIKRDMIFLQGYGMGEQLKRNEELFKKVQNQLYRNKHQPRRKVALK